MLTSYTMAPNTQQLRTTQRYAVRFTQRHKRKIDSVAGAATQTVRQERGVLLSLPRFRQALQSYRGTSRSGSGNLRHLDTVRPPRLLQFLIVALILFAISKRELRQRLIDFVGLAQIPCNHCRTRQQIRPAAGKAAKQIQKKSLLAGMNASKEVPRVRNTE